MSIKKGIEDLQGNIEEWEDPTSDTFIPEIQPLSIKIKSLEKRVEELERTLGRGKREP